MKGVPLRLTAQIYNDLQDLSFELEYTDQGVARHVPERVKEYLAKLMDNTQTLHELLEGEKACTPN